MPPNTRTVRRGTRNNPGTSLNQILRKGSPASKVFAEMLRGKMPSIIQKLGIPIETNWRKSSVISTTLPLRSKPSAASIVTFDSSSITPGVGKNTQVKQSWDMGATIAALYSVENQNEIQVDKAFETYECKSTCPFMVIPFVVLLENGESITQTDDDTDMDLITLIDSAIAGKFSIRVGKELIGSMIHDNGSALWIAKGSFSLTEIANEYSSKVAEKLLDEEALIGIKTGYFVKVLTDNTGVTIYKRRDLVYHSLIS